MAEKGAGRVSETPPKSGERHDSVPPRSSADAKDRGLIKLSKDKEPRRREGSSWPHTGDPDKVTWQVLVRTHGRQKGAGSEFSKCPKRKERSPELHA